MNLDRRFDIWGSSFPSINKISIYSIYKIRVKLTNLHFYGPIVHDYNRWHEGAMRIVESQFGV